MSKTQEQCAAPAFEFKESLLKQYSLALRRTTTQRKKIEAEVLIRKGFRLYQEKDLTSARRVFLDALQRDPAWIRNRGVVSILFQSFVGHRIFDFVRRIRKNA